MWFGIICWTVACACVAFAGWLGKVANVQAGGEFAWIAGLIFAALEGWI